MENPAHPSIVRLRRSIEAGEYAEAGACLRQIDAAAGEQKAALRAVRESASDRPEVVRRLRPELTSFLTHGDRPVRLTAAKLFVEVARKAPSAVRPCVDDLADRLADGGEFYYVRARSAEALGYVALEHPDEVASPALLADLQVGLSFDAQEVREKLAKAMAHVALGSPGRLRHQVGSVAEHLDDEDELVRYHLCTSLVAIGCEFPSALAEAEPELAARLDDGEPHVRGRAAEALGLLARGGEPAVGASALPADETERFAAERVAFARDALAGDERATRDGVGTIDGVGATVDEGARAISAPDGDRDCPHCGLSLPEDGPPACPRCGTPC